MTRAIDDNTSKMVDELSDSKKSIQTQEENTEKAKTDLQKTQTKLTETQTELTNATKSKDKVKHYQEQSELLTQQTTLNKQINDLTRAKANVVSDYYDHHSKVIEGMIAPIQKQIDVYTHINESLKKQFDKYKIDIDTAITDYNTVNDPNLTADQATTLIKKYL